MDQTLKTLHLRCGSDIRQTLTDAGLSGDFLEFADPFCIGPLPDFSTTELIKLRSHFLASAFNLDPAETLARQRQSYARLNTLNAYQRVVLWFEHDSYDQLILIYLLQHLARLRPTARLELIAIDQFPGIERFIGLGQLAPAQLASLWPHRQPISDALLASAAPLWAALCANDPRVLLAQVKAGTPALPMMQRALERHLQQLPGVHDGLGLTERLTLHILKREGPLPAGKAFATLMRYDEPLPYLGDLMYWWLLQPLLNGAAPLLHSDDDHLDWPQRTIRLTPQGEAVLQGQVDAFACRTEGYWVGGVELQPGQPHWRYDSAQQTLHLRSL